MQPLYDVPQWFVLRDLKRSNAKAPAYKVLPELGFETFTPMQWVVKDNPKGGKTRRHLPFIPSLLFARSLKSDLDAVVDRTETLQYRFVKGAPQNTPMTVPADEMDRFIRAVTSSHDCTFYTPEEVTPDMIGRRVMIVGGPMDGLTGHLLKKRGSKKKRLILQLRDAIAASVEVAPEYIRIL